MSASWRQYIHLHKKKKRQEEGKFIIEGVRLCHDALLSDWEAEIAFVAEDFTGSAHWEQFAELFKLKKITWRALPREHFDRLADTETPQGVLMVMRIPSYPAELFESRKTSFLVMLQGIRDPGNLGTIIRTADWYGAGAVILSGDCVDPFNSKVLRSTMGSIFQLPVAPMKYHIEPRHCSPPAPSRWLRSAHTRRSSMMNNEKGEADWPGSLSRMWRDL